METREQVRRTVVEAALGLLQEQGVSGLTTRAVAQAAGVQAPTIYRLFGDKDGLVQAVAERAVSDYVASKTVEQEQGDPVEDLREAWRRHVGFGLAHPHLFALLAVGGPSPATEAGLDVLRHRVRRIAAAGLLRVDEQRAVLMTHAAGTGTVLALLAATPERRDLGLSEATLEALLAGITVDVAASEDASPAGIAVTMAAVVPDLPGLSDAERALMGEWLARAVATS